MLITATFLALALAGVLNHELWRDEWQSWLIGRGSTSLRQLLDRLRDESQPPLWLTFLYLLGRVTSAPLAMQLAHALVATASVFVVARYAPFSRLEKTLYALGYFPLYEYCIVSRNYALGILCAWLFCLWLGQSRRGLALAALMGMVWSSHQAALIAAPMLALLVGGRRAAGKSGGGELPAVFTLVAFLGTAVLCAWMMSAPQVLGKSVSLQTTFDQRLLVRSLTTIWNAYVPLPHISAQGAQWNTNVLGTFNSWLGFSDHPGLLASDPLAAQELVAAGLALALLALSAWSLLRHRAVMLAVLSAQLLLVAATCSVYFGWLRHHGHVFVVFLMGCWILRDAARRSGAVAREGRRALLPVLLAVHVVGGVAIYATDLKRPFTASPMVPVFLRAAGLADLPLMGSPDYLITPLSGAVDRPFWSLDTGKLTTATQWKTSKGSGLGLLLERAGKRVRTSGRNGHLLITGFPLESQLGKLDLSRRTFWVKLTPLATFAPRMVPDEGYVVYYAQPRGTPVPANIRALAIGKTLKL